MIWIMNHDVSTAHFYEIRCLKVVKKYDSTR